MRRSYLEKVYFKNRSKNSLKAFINQKYFAVGCIKKTFLDSLNRSFVKDSKLFQKTAKSFFSDKGDHGSNKQLVKCKELLQDDKKILDELNTLFKNFKNAYSTQAFYLLKVSWKIRSFLCFNPYQNLTLQKKFKKR